MDTYTTFPFLTDPDPMRHKQFPTLPSDPDKRDYFNEIKWSRDPDPREDLIHPFVD